MKLYHGFDEIMNLFHSTRNRNENYKSRGQKNSFAALTRSCLATRFIIFDPISRTMEHFHYFIKAMVQFHIAQRSLKRAKFKISKSVVKWIFRDDFRFEMSFSTTIVPTKFSTFKL